MPDLFGLSAVDTLGGERMADGSFIALHLISELVTSIACFCAALGIAWYARYRRGMADEYRRVAMLLCTFAAACGLTRLVDTAMVWFPNYWLLGTIEALSAAMTLVAALAVWPKLPELIALPSSRDLQRVNERLAGEEVARKALVERLSQMNGELEERVARRTCELQEAKHRFEIALAGSHISVAQQDTELRYTWVHNPPEGLSPEAMMGHRLNEVLVHPSAQIVDIAKRRVLETGEAERLEVALMVGAETLWFDERIEPLFRDGALSGLMTVAIDVTPHKRYEQHLRSLLRELTHRSKNLLAVVQGVARQTAETVEALPDFVARFGARLQALSSAHELLVNRSWKGVALHDLVVREIEIDLPDVIDRVSISGEREILGPEAAQNLALGLHEMMTNAQIHGALSGPTGRVEVSWHRIEVEGRPYLELLWQERDGPPVDEPTRRGFGRTLIERLVPRAIEGSSDLVFAPEGVRWTLHIPVERLGEDA